MPVGSHWFQIYQYRAYICTNKEKVYISYIAELYSSILICKIMNWTVPFPLNVRAFELLKPLQYPPNFHDLLMHLPAHTNRYPLRISTCTSFIDHKPYQKLAITEQYTKNPKPHKEYIYRNKKNRANTKQAYLQKKKPTNWS